MSTRDYQFIVGPETSTLPTATEPSADGDIVNLGYANKTYTHGVADVAAVKAVAEASRTDNMSLWVDSLKAFFYFDSASSATGDDIQVITPTAGTGRWLKAHAAIPTAGLTASRIPSTDASGNLQSSGNATFSGNMTITGDLTVQGDTTTLNTATLDVEDVNITVNKGGNDATSEGAGLKVERTGTAGSLIYENALASRYKAGDLGSESEIMTVGTAQTVTGIKTLDVPNTLKQIATPATPAAGYNKIYPKSDDRMYVLDDNGVESKIMTFQDVIPIANGGTGESTANPAFNALSPLTTKGDLVGYSTVNARIPIGSNDQVLTADSTQTLGLKWATPASSPTASYDIQNLGISATVAANALTIALKQSDGSTDPSTGTAAVKVGFGSATIGSGSYSTVSVTAALSTVISSGSTLGHANGVAKYIYVYLGNDAGTAFIAYTSTPISDEGILYSTTAEGGAGAADSATTIYSTAAHTNIVLRLIGRIKSTQATAGTWATTPSDVRVMPFYDDHRDSTSSQTANFTFAETDSVALCATSGGSFTASLPSATSMYGKEFTVVKTDTSTNYVVFNGIYLSTQYESVRVKSDGSNWQTISHYIHSGAFQLYTDGTFSSTPASGQYGDFTTLTLGAGEWELAGTIHYQINTGTGLGSAWMAITSTSGNSGAGVILGYNYAAIDVPTASQETSGNVAKYRVNITTATSYYLKGGITYSGGQPRWTGSISARKINS